MRNNTQVHNKAQKSMSNTKNVEAFEKLVGICTGYGAQYSAGSQNLRIENLLSLLARSQAAMKSVSDAKTNFENATNGREVVAKEVSNLVSRVLAELKSSGAMEQTIDDARMMVRKIKGSSASSPVAPPAAAEAKSTVATHSRRSGKDYEGFAHHFEKLIQTLSSEPLYQPLEPELQVAGLQNTLARLRNGNSNVATANGVLKKARRDRNAVLYTDKYSLYKTALAVKQRAKAAFGYNSEAAYDASHIRFIKPHM